MKNIKSFVSALILIFIVTFSINSYAVTLPWLDISSNNYTEGKITQSKEEINKIEVGEILQLYAHIYQGNDVADPENPDSMGLYVLDSNLNNITWSSSDTSVATIDAQGKITGLKVGTTTIKAINNGVTNYDKEKEATKEIEVIGKSDVNDYVFKPSRTIRN